MILLKDVYNSYQQKEYKKALTQFKQAKVTQEQSGVAKQLKAEIINQLSLEYFHELKFKDCIDLLQTNFIVQAKPDFPIPIERSKVIVGMCYLFLSDFSKASECLKTSISHTDTSSYYYYYILSEIYKGTFLLYKDFKFFYKEFVDYLSKVSTEKMLFLEAVFYLQKGDIAKFVKTNKKANPESVSQQINFSFLSGINLKKKKDTHLTSLKPLYKIINKSTISLNENLYLLSVPGLNDYIKEIENKKTDKNQYEEIINLCITGNPLCDSTFNSIINDKELEYRDQLIFNQISALIANRPEQNKGEPSSDFKTVNAKHFIIENCIKKHRNIFFSFQESLNTYFSFSSNCFLTDAYSYFENIFFYIETHKKTLNDYKYEAICLNAASVCGKNFPNFKNEVYVNKFIKIKANLLGLLIINVQSYINGSNKIDNDIHLVFSNPFLNELGIKEINEFFYFFKGVVKSAGTDYIIYRIKEYFFTVLIREIPLSPSNKAILNLHDALNDFLGEYTMSDEYSPENKDFLYVELNLNRLKYFREDNDKSAFYDNFKTIEFCVQNDQLKQKIALENIDNLGVHLIEIVKQNNEIPFFNIALKILSSQDSIWGFSKTQSIKNLIYEIYKVMFELKTDKELQKKFAIFLNEKYKDEKFLGISIRYILSDLIDRSGTKDKLIIFEIFAILSEPFISNQEYYYIAFDFFRFINKMPIKNVFGEEKILFIKKLLDIYESKFIHSKNKTDRQLYNQTVTKFCFGKPLLGMIAPKPKKKIIDKGYKNFKLFD